MSVYDWSTTALDNQMADAAINWREGQNANTANNSARAMMAAQAAFLAQINGSITSGGSANAYTFTSPSGFAFSSYFAGMMIAFQANFSNTGAATVNVDALGAKALKKFGDAALVQDDVETGNIVQAIYDGTNFQIVSLIGNNNLSAFANLAGAADKMAYFTAAGALSLMSVTSFIRTLLDDDDAAIARATLGLGSIATQAAGSVSITGGAISGITDLPVADGGTGASSAANARTNLGVKSMAIRDVTLSTSAPSGGADGDVWLRYV